MMSRRSAVTHLRHVLLLELLRLPDERPVVSRGPGGVSETGTASDKISKHQSSNRHAANMDTKKNRKKKRKRKEKEKEKEKARTGRRYGACAAEMVKKSKSRLLLQIGAPRRPRRGGGRRIRWAIG